MQNTPGTESSSSTGRYGQPMDDFKKGASDFASDIGDDAKNSMQTLSHSADKTARRIQSLVNDGDAMLRDRVTQSPMAALGIAMLVGALAANAFRRH